MLKHSSKKGEISYIIESRTYKHSMYTHVGYWDRYYVNI